MAQEIKELIEKINKEGVAAANLKAQEIEDLARRHAEDIIEQAKKEAEKIISQARAEANQIDEKEKALLVQAGRDFLLSVKKEVNAMLEHLLVLDAQAVLAPEAMYKIISELIQNSAEKQKDAIEVALKKEDADLLARVFLARLKEETKKNIILKSSEDIKSGFTISFDQGKSCYDFSDKALAEYIGNYLKPKLNDLLKSAL